MMLYKTMNGQAGAYGHGEWSMPTQTPEGEWLPGEWMPPVKPALCASGYHVCRNMTEVVVHLSAEIYEVEVRGEHDDGDDKAAYEQARLVRRLWADTWTEQAQRLFAVDCARTVAELSPDPDLTHAALDIVTARTLYGHEWAAAEGAAGAAVWVAAENAAENATWAAAWGAAQEAAGDAAREAAWVAAWEAMRQRQAALLERYLAGEPGPLVEREI